MSWEHRRLTSAAYILSDHILPRVMQQSWRCIRWDKHNPAEHRQSDYKSDFVNERTLPLFCRQNYVPPLWCNLDFLRHPRESMPQISVAGLPCGLKKGPWESRTWLAIPSVFVTRSKDKQLVSSPPCALTHFYQPHLRRSVFISLLRRWQSECKRPCASS